MEQILVTELTSLKDQGIEVNFMGNRTMLPQSLVKLMERWDYPIASCESFGLP